MNDGKDFVRTRDPKKMRALIAPLHLCGNHQVGVVIFGRKPRREFQSQHGFCDTWAEPFMSRRVRRGSEPGKRGSPCRAM